jgi:peroxiredoxin
MSDDLLAVGSEAPDFRLTAHTGEEVHLSKHRNRENVVLVFYPRNNTPG